jgi:hypothetical protein
MPLMPADDLETARAARRTGLDLALAGRALPEIEARLRAEGYGDDTLARAMPAIAEAMEEAYRNNARRSLTFGPAIIGAALLVSLFSWAVFGFSGVVLVGWGALAVGAALTVRGFIYQRRLDAFLATRPAARRPS